MQPSASSQPQLVMVLSSMKAIIGIALVTFAVQGVEVTPLEKVTGLLESLSKEIAEEGKEEAASYDKYACFCKEQADEKTAAIEKSQGKIEYLNADIKELSAKIADLNGDVSDLNEKISEIEKDVNKGKGARNTEHEEYLAKARDMDEAISGAVGAREAIQNAKTSMKGAKLNLVQLKTLQAVLSKHPMVNDASMRLLAMSRQPAFQVQSNDILATIDEIEADFRKMKNDLDNDESEAKFQWNQKQMSLMRESTFSAKDRDEKAQMSESKTEELEEAKLSKDEESKDLAADEAFLKEVTEGCEAKAKSFDERSSARSAELTAITKALDALKEGNAGKMSELQRGSRSGVLSSSPPRVISLARKPGVAEEAFIQIRSVRHHLSERMVAMKRAQLFIAAAAEKSPELSTLAVRMKLAGDHFVKVRNLIKDLLAKLKSDAAAEAETKGLCDKDMNKALSDRDEATGKIEAASAQISTLTAAKNSLVQENADLNKQISKLMKGLNEATELRQGDSAENEKAIALAAAAIHDVKQALQVLQNFYKGSSLAQTSNAYVRKSADRSGKSVDDLAPVFFQHPKKSSEATGVLGLLDVILSDFERAKKKATVSEEDQQEEFTKFKKKATDDVTALKKKMKTNEGDLTDKQTELLSQIKSRKDGKELLKSAEKQLEGLKAMCVDGPEDGSGRAEKRMAEIESLKEGIKLLESWQQES